jgi:hypothetical protein
VAEELNMWKWLNCYLSGRHEFGVWCEPGAIFLRCMHCGKRSSGWAVDRMAHRHAKRVTHAMIASEQSTPRVLPFDRAVSR